MASLSRDDPQGRTSGILGICRKAPGTEDQAKILTLKTDQELQENPQNRRTPNADYGERPYADQIHQPIRVPAREVKQNALIDQNNPETRTTQKQEAEKSQEVKIWDQKSDKTTPGRPGASCKMLLGAAEVGARSAQWSRAHPGVVRQSQTSQKVVKR